MFYFETGGPALPLNEVISSHIVENLAVQIKCFHLCQKEPKCVGFNYRITTINVENCQLTNVTKKRDTAQTGFWTLLRDIEAVG
jgi:hypothetical protein